MILNYPLILAEDLAGTVSSKIFDSVTQGDAEKQLWVRITAGKTAVTSGSFAVMTSNEVSGAPGSEELVSAKTLISVDAVAGSEPGAVIMQARLPLGVLQYLRIVPTGADGTYNAEIVQDVESMEDLINTPAVVG